MSDPIQSDHSFSADDLALAVNAAEQEFFSTDKSVVYTVIAGRGPDEGENKIVPIAAVAPPLPDGIVIRTFPLSTDQHEVASQLDAIEQSEPLILRRWARAFVDGSLAWVALFDKKPAVPPPSADVLRIEGKISHFGGPEDTGMARFEDTAFVFDDASAADFPGFFLPQTPGFPTGWGRRLDTSKHYIACRWDQLGIPKNFLRKPTSLITVLNARTGVQVTGVRAIDAGPAVWTGRVADLSPAVEELLGLRTDDIAAVLIPRPGDGTAQARLKPEDLPVKKAAPGKRRTTFLDGTYTHRKELAGTFGCTHTIDFHFNSGDGPAFGPEVYFKPGDKTAKTFAETILAAIRSLMLKDTRADGLQSADKGTRAGYIAGYPAHAILLEPLFISEAGQAKWIKDSANLELLSQVVAQAIRTETDESDLIGLSIGHLGNTARPGDTGAPAFGGGVETDFNAPMARRIAEILNA